MIERQNGSVLVIGLIMLVLLTLIAVSSITSTTGSIQIVGNAQFRDEATAAAQKAIETVISSKTFLTTPPAAQSIDINGDGTADYTVTFSPAPACVYYKPIGSSDTGVPKVCTGSPGVTLCYWTNWDIAATVSDPVTNAQIVVHQGVKTIAGINSALKYCGV